MIPFSRSPRSFSAGVSCGRISQYTRFSRTRLAMSCVYCEPKSRMAMISFTGGPASRRRSRLVLHAEDRLLVCDEAVHGALSLRGVAPALVANLVGLDGPVEVGDAPLAEVLKALPEALDDVGDEVERGPPVEDKPRHALGHLDGAVAVEIAFAASLLHRLHGRHAAVLLHADAILVEELARRLLRSREEGAHHPRARPAGESLGERARVRDAAVGDDRQVELAAVPRALVDG